MITRHRCTLPGAIMFLLASAACGDSFDDTPPTGSAANGGNAGTAGNAPDASTGDDAGGAGGTGGTSGAGGVGGSATGGDAGAAGAGGAAGSGATGGTAGSGATGGTAGSGATGGTGGTGPEDGGLDGQAGSGGSSPTDAGACAPYTGDCDGDLSNGCETPIDTVDNCGGCTVVCTPSEHALPVCANGACGIECSAGFADCNGQLPDGCETPLTTILNCNGCGLVCEFGADSLPTCTNQTCGLQCSADHADCDGIATTGCEVATLSDTLHCGSCGNACPTGLAHATTQCAGGQCGIQCLASWGNCDNQTPNGCEADLMTTVSDCGTCGNACPARPNSTPLCQTGACTITCSVGYASCNSSDADGCEINTTSDVANCGSCGHGCGTANATPTCAGGTCSLQCNSGFADCDGTNANGCEVDLASNVDNCGSCGRDCGQGTCVSGQCTAWVLGEETIQPKRIAVGSTHVYWTITTAVRRVSKTGGAVGTVASAITSAMDLAVDDTFVYWVSTQTSGFIYRTPLAGGAIFTLASGQPNPSAIALDGGRVYFSVDGAVKRVAKSGGTVATLATSQTGAGGLAVDATNLFWATDENPGAVRKTPIASMQPSNVATNLNRPVDVDLSSTHVFFVTIAGGTLSRVAKDGTGLTNLSTGLDSPTSVAVAGTKVFFTEANAGKVWEIPAAGGTAIPRFTGGGYPYELCQDATTLYWVDVGNNRIYAMTK